MVQQPLWAPAMGQAVGAGDSQAQPVSLALWEVCSGLLVARCGEDMRLGTEEGPHTAWSFRKAPWRKNLVSDDDRAAWEDGPSLQAHPGLDSVPGLDLYNKWMLQ